MPGISPASILGKRWWSAARHALPSKRWKAPTPCFAERRLWSHQKKAMESLCGWSKDRDDASTKQSKMRLGISRPWGQFNDNIRNKELCFGAARWYDHAGDK